MTSRLTLIAIILIVAQESSQADDKGKQALRHPPTQFSEGMVTLSFDDGWGSQYSEALPLLKVSGLQATFYLISTTIQNNAKFPNYMTPEMATTIADDGHEIGGHTITHPHLTKLSSPRVTDEITASRAYLQNLTGKTINSFAYPFGSLNRRVKNLIIEAGFTSARGVHGYSQNTPSSDKYNLHSWCVRKSDTLAEIEAQIAQAKANRTWFILCIHEVRDIGGDYSIPASELQAIVDYIKQSGVKVVTVSQGISLMQRRRRHFNSADAAFDAIE